MHKKLPWQAWVSTPIWMQSALKIGEAAPALQDVLLGRPDTLMPLAQLAQLGCLLLRHLGGLGCMPLALALQALLQLQCPGLSSTLHYVLQ